MKSQVLHIFRKDLRRQWREITVSVAAVAAYAWNTATRPIAEYPLDAHVFLSKVLPPLVPIAWAFLIVRVLQEERLVGDRQFWVTRPYEWKKLLAAKLLFVLLFVKVPLLILHVFLLIKAGFSPISHVSGLLWLQLMWTWILILPAVTLASITGSIGQAALVVLCALLYVMGGAALDSVVPNAGVLPDSLPDSVELVLVVGTALWVVFQQFSRRRTGQSRLLLLGAAAAVPIFMFATPYQTLIDHTYRRPSAGQQHPAELRFDPAKPETRNAGFPEKNKVHVSLPLIVSSITSGSVVRVHGTRVSIQAPGEQWSSGWQASGLSLLADHPHAQTDITIDQGFFDQVKSTPITLHISFLLTLFQGKDAKRIFAESGPFTVPGNGRCSFAPIWSNEILCVFPLKRPFLLSSVRAEETTCAPRADQKPLPAGTIGYGWIWNQDSNPAEFGISPVQLTPLSLADWGEVNYRDFRPRVCPGTPLTFTSLEETQHTRSELDINGIRLADYKLNDSWQVGAGFTIGLP